MTPKSVTDAELVFGPATWDHLAGPHDTVPEEFKSHRGTRWNEIVTRWFFRGLPKETEFVPKPGVDGDTAVRHIHAMLRSYEPKHQHKEAACAYLLSTWFDDVKIPE